MDQSIIRRHFIEHYCSQGFELLPRASLLHPSIPMSFVMSAGLVQVETVLAEQKKDLTGNKFVLFQKCFRHFDMSQVGKDNRHLSLFNMAGAFVFGVDLNRKIIPNVWNFVTNVLKMNKNKIWITYFKGGEVNGQYMSPDLETLKAWQKIGVDPSRIVGLGADDNYWAQSDVSSDDNSSKKCGPNTELFFDRGQHLKCTENCLPGCDCGRFIEFSNTLFVQYQFSKDSNTIEKTKTPFVETVIGLERVSFILKEFESVFDLPKYQELMYRVKLLSGHQNLPSNWSTQACQLIADHVFALYALVSDGAPPPGKGGRQRLMRCLVRQVITQQKILEIKDPRFFKKIIHCAAKILGHNIQARKSTIKTLCTYFEEESKIFEKTVIRGEKVLSQYLHNKDGKPITGCQIVELEKKMGLPQRIIAAKMLQRNQQFPNYEYQDSLKQWQIKTVPNIA